MRRSAVRRIAAIALRDLQDRVPRLRPVHLDRQIQRAVLELRKRLRLIDDQRHQARQEISRRKCRRSQSCVSASNSSTVLFVRQVHAFRRQFRRHRRVGRLEPASSDFADSSSPASRISRLSDSPISIRRCRLATRTLKNSSMFDEKMPRNLSRSIGGLRLVLRLLQHPLVERERGSLSSGRGLG
jgi:hypothetical protein